MSHIRTKKSVIRDLDMLVSVLERRGLTLERGRCIVRGYQDKKAAADAAIRFGSADIGLRRMGDGTYDVVQDTWQLARDGVLAEKTGVEFGDKAGVAEWWTDVCQEYSVLVAQSKALEEGWFGVDVGKLVETLNKALADVGKPDAEGDITIELTR